MTRAYTAFNQDEDYDAQIAAADARQALKKDISDKLNKRFSEAIHGVLEPMDIQDKVIIYKKDVDHEYLITTPYESVQALSQAIIDSTFIGSATQYYFTDQEAINFCSPKQYANAKTHLRNLDVKNRYNAQHQARAIKASIDRKAKAQTNSNKSLLKVSHYNKRDIKRMVKMHYAGDIMIIMKPDDDSRVINIILTNNPGEKTKVLDDAVLNPGFVIFNNMTLSGADYTEETLERKLDYLLIGEYLRQIMYSTPVEPIPALMSSAISHYFGHVKLSDLDTPAQKAVTYALKNFLGVEAEGTNHPVKALTGYLKMSTSHNDTETLTTIDANSQATGQPLALTVRQVTTPNEVFATVVKQNINHQAILSIYQGTLTDKMLYTDAPITGFAVITNPASGANLVFEEVVTLATFDKQTAQFGLDLQHEKHLVGLYS